MEEADWESQSIDLGIKYKGIFLQAEFYRRWLDHFVADGVLPVEQIVDDGFLRAGGVLSDQAEARALRRRPRWVFGDEDAGFGDSCEYIIGANWYPFGTRNARINAQVIDVTRSAASSVFGFYVGGQTGTTYSVAASLIF